MIQVSDQASDLPIPSSGLSADRRLRRAPAARRGRALGGHDELRARLCETLQPSDVLERIWTRDVVDLMFRGAGGVLAERPNKANGGKFNDYHALARRPARRAPPDPPRA